MDGEEDLDGGGSAPARMLRPSGYGEVPAFSGFRRREGVAWGWTMKRRRHRPAPFPEVLSLLATSEWPVAGGRWWATSAARALDSWIGGTGALATAATATGRSDDGADGGDGGNGFASPRSFPSPSLCQDGPPRTGTAWHKVHPTICNLLQSCYPFPAAFVTLSGQSAYGKANPKGGN